MPVRGAKALAPLAPLIFRSNAGEPWFLGAAAIACAAFAAFAWSNAITIPGVLLSGVAIVAAVAALHLVRWRLVLDDQGVRTEGLMAQPVIPWPDVAAVQVEEPRARSSMKLRFVPRSGLSAEGIAFPLRRLIEDDRRRLVEALASRGHHLQLGQVGF